MYYTIVTITLIHSCAAICRTECLHLFVCVCACECNPLRLRIVIMLIISETIWHTHLRCAYVWYRHLGRIAKADCHRGILLKNGVAVQLWNRYTKELLNIIFTQINDLFFFMYSSDWIVVIWQISHGNYTIIMTRGQWINIISSRQLICLLSILLLTEYFTYHRIELMRKIPCWRFISYLWSVQYHNSVT